MMMMMSELSYLDIWLTQVRNSATYGPALSNREAPASSFFFGVSANFSKLKAPALEVG